MAYIDGFVVPVPKKDLAAYRKLARLACRTWMKHGALQYVEAVGDDLAVHHGMAFPKAYKLKANEKVVFAWILYKSRRHRDTVNAKVMADPDFLKHMAPGAKMPFVMKRMSHGGFASMIMAVA